MCWIATEEGGGLVKVVSEVLNLRDSGQGVVKYKARVPNMRMVQVGCDVVRRKRKRLTRLHPCYPRRNTATAN